MYIALGSRRARHRTEQTLQRTLDWICAFGRTGPKCACATITEEEWQRVKGIPSVTVCRRCTTGAAHQLALPHISGETPAERTVCAKRT